MVRNGDRVKIVVGGDQYPEYINGAATLRLARGLVRAGHTVDLLWPTARIETYERRYATLVASRRDIELPGHALTMAA